jgi:predicted PurR-regulated permease PerM
MALPNDIRVTITPGSVVAVLAMLLGVWLVMYLWDLVLILLTAVVISSSIEPLSTRLARIGLPRVAAVMALYVLLLGGIASLVYFFVPPLVHEAKGFFTLVPEYLDGLELAQPFSGSSTEITALREQLSEWATALSSTGSGITAVISTVFGGLLSFMLILVLSFYLAVREEGIDDFVRLVTPLAHREYALDLWRRSQRKIGLWMQGQLLLSLIVGVLVYIGLTAFGIRYALLLAIIAAILELIPVFGSIIAAIPAIAIAAIDGGTPLALITIGIYIIINQLQGNLIYPLVVQKVVGVPPLLVILALLAGAKIAGFLGILLSVPAAAVILELVRDFDRKRSEPLNAELVRD